MTTTIDDLFTHIRAGRTLYTGRNLAGESVYRERPDNRAAVHAPCLVCGVHCAALLGGPQLCARCRERPNVLEEAVQGALAQFDRIRDAWTVARWVAGPQTRKRFRRLAADREVAQMPEAAPEWRAKVEGRIARARAKGDGLSELLATETELGNQYILAAERLVKLRAALEESR